MERENKKKEGNRVGDYEACDVPDVTPCVAIDVIAVGEDRGRKRVREKRGGGGTDFIDSESRQPLR